MKFDGGLRKNFRRLAFQMEMMPSGKRRAINVFGVQNALNALFAVQSCACVCGGRHSQK
jgi:hypothetical protein